MPRPPSDEHWMRRAAALARRAEGCTSPNPIVGAIVVKDGRALGMGFHARAGLPHAEVVALREAGEAARGADLYVTLEPCAHHGRTPPCVDAIIAAGIARVIVGVRDPNPLVNGRGVAALRNAGITVTQGVLEATCLALVAPYAHFQVTRRPYVHLKVAVSADGRIAPPRGSSRWITGKRARWLGHRLRRRADTVLVGVGTVLSDDPALSVRLCPCHGPPPRPVVLDTMARTPPSARLVREARGVAPLVFCGTDAPAERQEALEAAGARCVRVERDEEGRIPVSSVLAWLAGEGVQSVLVEGGSKVFASFLRGGLVDRVTLFVAPVFLGEGGTPAVASLGEVGLDEVPRGRVVAAHRVGADVVIDIDMGARCSPD